MHAQKRLLNLYFLPHQIKFCWVFKKLHMISSEVINSFKCIEAETKLLTCYRRLSIMHVIQWRCLYFGWQFTRIHDDVIKWKHFPRNWPFVREIHRSPVNYPHKGQWRAALMFYLICVWINDWVNNREAGDLRRYRAHSDVIVMVPIGRSHWQNVSIGLHNGLVPFRRQAISEPILT